MFGSEKYDAIYNKIRYLISLKSEKYKVNLTKIEDFKNIELKALAVYDGRYIKTKIRTFDEKVYINFRGLNVPEDDIKCESVTVIFIDSILVYDKKYYLQVC